VFKEFQLKEPYVVELDQRGLVHFMSPASCFTLFVICYQLQRCFLPLMKAYVVDQFYGKQYSRKNKKASSGASSG
jgi:hypothetical protein